MRFTCEYLSFQYKKEKPLFHDLSFTLEKGEILAILGPNGAGKSTLLKCLLGFIKANEGTVSIDGIPADDMNRALFFQKIGYVPQARNNAFAYTVFETVLLGRSAYLGMFHQPTKKDEQYAFSALEKTGIVHLKDAITSQLSGGELQLVLIARALCSQPELLILDEPETGLDFKNQMKILALLQQFAKDGMTIIFNTHDPSHALQIAQNALFLLPDASHLYGQTKQIITETTLEKAYGLPVRIESYENYYSIMPMMKGETNE